MDASQIRLLILTTKWDDAGSTAFTSAFIHEAVVQTALQKKLLDRKPDHNAATALEKAVFDVVWELILEGVFAPGSRLYNANQLPHLHITEYGRKCFDAGQLTPHDADGYLERIKKDNPRIDAITLMYLGEALHTFRSGNHLATAVMVGVAAENILLKLVDAVQAALDTTARQTKFEQMTKGKKAKDLHDEVLVRIKSPAKPLPIALSPVVQRHLNGIFDLIRESRNDAGHPTGRRMERSETQALLLLFPVYCKTAHDLMDWLVTNKI